MSQGLASSEAHRDDRLGGGKGRMLCLILGSAHIMAVSTDIFLPINNTRVTRIGQFCQAFREHQFPSYVY